MSSAALPPKALILAAGLSSRMKAPGSPHKAVLELNGESLLSRAASALRGGGVEDIRVVTGHEAGATEKEAERLGLSCVRNPAYADGMFSSVSAGLASLRLEEGGAFLLLPVDASLVWRGSVAALVALWQGLPADKRGRACVIPTFAGRCGHPPLLGAALAHDLAGYQGRGGVRGFLGSLLPPSQRGSFLRGIAAAENTAPGAHAPGNGPFALQRIRGADADSAFFYLPLPDKGLLSDLDQPSDIVSASLFLDNTRQRQGFVPQEAWEWLRHAGLGVAKTRHSVMVGLGAFRLGLALQRRAYEADPVLHLCAGLLHDVGRGRPAHTELARCWIENWGMRDCALVAGAHTMLPAPVLGRLGVSLRDDPEAKDRAGFDAKDYESAGRALVNACACVYVADKLFQGDRQVSIATRFEGVRARFAHDAAALRVLVRREEIALQVAERLAEKLADSPDNVVALDTGHSFEVMCAGMLESLAT